MAQRTKTSLDAGRAAALSAEAAELYRRGRIKSACTVQEQLVELLGGAAKRDDFALLSLYHFSAGMEKAAADIIEEALERWPDDPELLANLGISYLRANIFDKAGHWLTKAVAVSPDAPNLHDGLARLYMEQGDKGRAIEHGERALLLKDEEAEARGPDGIDLGQSAVRPFDASRPERNIIAFSLWGTCERYLSAAVTNARLAPHIYPGWSARFYCEEGVPESILADLLDAGAHVVMKPPQTSLYEGLFWRFEPALEKDVERFLIRDADSVISVRERLAVEEWISSGCHFHVMRDFLTHTDPILAGLWGGVGGCLPGRLKDGFSAYLEDPGKTANCDQKFLRERIWPIARQSCLVHDSNFQVLGARPFPGGEAFSGDGTHRGHIGSSEHVRKPRGIRTLQGASSAGKLDKRKRFVFILSPCEAYREKLLADPHGEHESWEIRELEPGEPSADFLMEGNSPAVHRHWRRQAMILRSGVEPGLLASSRDLLFSGLMENVGLFCEDAAVEFIMLRQTVLNTARAIGSREQLAPLDSANRIVNPGPFVPLGEAGHVFWHALEALTRMSFYETRLSGLPNVSFTEAEMPGPPKSSARTELDAQLEDIASRFKRQPADLARRFASGGGWLG